MTNASQDVFAEGSNSEESSARRVSERVVPERSAAQSVSERKPSGDHLSDVMREVCSTGERRGIRVVSPQKRGHVFFDQGHVVHAEFGEDVGLRALLEMLRSSALELQPCARPWPSQPSLFLSAEVVFAALGQAQPETSRVATEVRRRVHVFPERETNEIVPPPRVGVAARPPAGLPARVPAGLLDRTTVAAPDGARATLPNRSQLAGPVPAAGTASSRANSQPMGTAAAARSAPERVAATRSVRAAASAPQPRPEARAPAAVIPPSSARPAAVPPSSPAPALGASGVERVLAADAAAAGNAPRGAPSRTGNVFWARQKAAPSELVPRSEPLPSSTSPHSVRTLVAGTEPPPTTMVRVSARGVILAARGAESERLADAAAFIYNQAKLIAADLGRHGRAAVHVRGGGLSLLVVKSEVNDVAAALGSTERLKSLLRKVGFG